MEQQILSYQTPLCHMCDSSQLNHSCVNCAENIHMQNLNTLGSCIDLCSKLHPRLGKGDWRRTRAGPRIQLNITATQFTVLSTTTMMVVGGRDKDSEV